jgi:hypothetical protein
VFAHAIWRIRKPDGGSCVGAAGALITHIGSRRAARVLPLPGASTGKGVSSAKSSPPPPGSMPGQLPETAAGPCRPLLQLKLFPSLARRASNGAGSQNLASPPGCAAKRRIAATTSGKPTMSAYSIGPPRCLGNP